MGKFHPIGPLTALPEEVALVGGSVPVHPTRYIDARSYAASLYLPFNNFYSEFEQRLSHIEFKEHVCDASVPSHLWSSV